MVNFVEGDDRFGGALGEHVVPAGVADDRLHGVLAVEDVPGTGARSSSTAMYSATTLTDTSGKCELMISTALAIILSRLSVQNAQMAAR